MTFTDIKIADLDEVASKPTGEGAMWRMVLKLSAQAPAIWAEHFNTAWHQNIYMMKRRAEARSNSIEIVCVPEELQDDHLPELKKVISETNEAYKAFLSEEGRQATRSREAVDRDKQRISDLKGKLNLD